jgi:ABC-2 type transport system permease protein
VSDGSAVAFRSAAGHFWAVLWGSAVGYLKRSNAYLIDIIRWPLFPLMLYATLQVTYRAAGRTEAGGANVPGFLLVGIVGLLVWGATIWAGGYAIEWERSTGTIAALLLSPASRVAVVLGYGLGGIVWLLPGFAMVGLLGLATGARFDVSTPLAPLLAVAALIVGAVAVGFALASFFVLSRRANVLANFLQTPVYLLAGFAVPRQELPGWLRPLSDALPVSHAIDALRASTLRGAGVGEIAGEVGWALVTAAAFGLVGIGGLRRVERVAKRGGELEFF